MAAPTEIVTRNTQQFLGDAEVVALALRVEWGVDTETVLDGRALEATGWIVSPVVVPIAAAFRTLGRLRRHRTDPEAGVGILALCQGDAHFLLASTPFMRKRPFELVERIPASADLTVDVGRLETDLVAELTIGDHTLLVNSIDFKKLLTAVEAGTVQAPQVAANLPRLKAVGRPRFG